MSIQPSRNYSAASAAYKLICRGFPVGAVQSIILTNKLAIATDDHRPDGRGIRRFRPRFLPRRQNDINITYNGTWTKQAVAAANGGTRTYTTVANPATNYTFQVKNAARFVLFTSSGPTGGTMHVCITPWSNGVANGSTTCSDRSLFRATLLYQQQQAFEGLDSTLTYKVEVTNVSPPPVPPAAAKYIDLDAVQVFAPTAALTPGLYQQDNANITYTGSGWIKQAVAAAPAVRSRIYATGPTRSWRAFQVTGAARFTIYTFLTAPSGGTMRVCIAAGIETCYNRSDNSSVALWQQKQAFGGLDTNTLYTVTVTNVSTVATQFIDLDAIEVFAAPLPLGLGLWQQENANIAYTGAGWKLATTTLASGGNSRYTYGLGDSYKFQIINAGRFALYTSATTTGGTMQVCIALIPTGATLSCITRNIKNNVAVYQQPQVFTGLHPNWFPIP